jgi:surface carbohydrate biosynthesis protein (TIGR04326 family)
MNSEFIKLFNKKEKKIIYWSKKDNPNKETKNFLNFIKKKRSKIICSFKNCIKEINKKKINKKSFRIRTKIMDGHYLLDYSALNEKCIYSNPELLNLLKIIGLINFLRNRNITKVEINIDDQISSSTLEKYFVNKKIYTIVKKKKKKIIFRSICPEIIKTFFFLIIYFIKNFKFFIVKKKTNISKNIFVSYFIKKKKINKNIQHFWGNLTKLLAKKEYNFNLINLSHVNLKNTSLIGKKYFFLKNYLSIFDIFKSILFYLIFYFKNYYLISSNIFFSTKVNLDLQFFLKKILEKSFFGFKSLETIIIIHNIKKFVEYSKTKNILYIAENQSWEKILNYEAKKKQIKTFAVIHSLINKWDMRYVNTHSEINKLKFLPSFFLVNGEYNKLMLAEKEIIKNLIKVESLRYSFLELAKRKKIKYNIVIFGSFQEFTTKTLLDEINKSSQIKSKFRIYFKDHPSTKSNLKYEYKYLNFGNIKNGYIGIVPNNSSVIIDLILKKIPVLTYDDKFNLNANYYEILQRKNSFSNYQDLEFLLLKKFNQITLESRLEKLSELYLNSKLTLWKKFIKKYL